MVPYQDQDAEGEPEAAEPEPGRSAGPVKLSELDPDKVEALVRGENVGPVEVTPEEEAELRKRAAAAAKARWGAAFRDPELSRQMGVGGDGQQ